MKSLRKRLENALNINYPMAQNHKGVLEAFDLMMESNPPPDESKAEITITSDEFFITYYDNSKTYQDHKLGKPY